MWKRFAKETLKETGNAVGGTILAYGIFQTGSKTYASGQTLFGSQTTTNPKAKPEEKASMGMV
ncbi:hypothetical protein Lnau_1790 [Legionella nautarum]|uniref:Uncharacterized protein n=1 Tax=Legionella nautarum TaxID=45070 RepID=A0A0W0WX51_9GAMM|nr:hypothetical protein [Legionella nautarum]KTD36806.1 hypothetical protein Lnau_1790 [Legionella nautarum]